MRAEEKSAFSKKWGGFGLSPPPPPPPSWVRGRTFEGSGGQRGLGAGGPGALVFPFKGRGGERVSFFFPGVATGT